MKRTFRMAFYGLAAIAVLASCQKVNVPSQKEIETKIVGKWKLRSQDGQELLTNGKGVRTFFADGSMTQTMSGYVMNPESWVWAPHEVCQYSVNGNEVSVRTVASVPSKEFHGAVESINDSNFTIRTIKKIVGGVESSSSSLFVYDKVSVDYSEAIIGTWEGVEMTGDDTHGDANHRIEYREDGSYTYYDKDGENWIPSSDVDNEFDVDGDWLSTRWRAAEGADYDYEWWDIVSIKDGTMKWSALREKDGKRSTATFTWKKVN